MSRHQSTIVLFLLIAGIVGIAVVTRPEGDTAQAGSQASPTATAASAFFAQPTVPVQQTAPALPSPLPPPTVMPPPGSGETPQAAYAGQIQPAGTAAGTAAPGSGTLQGWNPPPLEVPLARHPFDHFWFIRPVGPNNNNFGLAHYPFGSDGPANDLRIHHGIDLANPIGVEVYAGADGMVIWAGKGHINQYEAITAYGNTIVIEHDFGINGQPIYTLYAHLSALLVESGQRVESGQVIGLIGNTGQVSGPHVHFEVRVGHDRYNAVRNPELWIASYIGTGVIAGRIALEGDTPVYDAAITVISVATGQPVYHTSSYAGPGINADDNWQENFVAPDIPAGRYIVRARHDAGTWAGQVEVVAGTTNWVEMEQTDEPPDAVPTPDTSGFDPGSTTLP